MKKVLNVLGAIGAFFLTIVFTTLLLCYSLVMNVRYVVSENGINNIVKNIDVVEVIKSVDDGALIEDIQFGDSELKLTEEQFEEILNSDAIKEEFSGILNKVLNSVTGEVATISRDEFVELVDTVIDEYNKVADVKITEEERNEAISAIEQEDIDDINESLKEVNLAKELVGDEKVALEVIDYVVFGGFSFAMLIAVIIIVLLIAACRAFTYKWMPYVGVGSLIASMLILCGGAFVSFIPVDGVEAAEFINQIKDTVATNLYITGGILFVVYVVLIVLGRILKKRHIKEKANELDVVEDKVEEEIKEEQQ